MISPTDWNGFDLTGQHDNASIFARMGAQVPVSGGVIRFPPGQIATSAACLLPSRTTVEGQGDATTIICLPTFPEWSTAPRAAFINRQWTTGGGEVGIQIRDLRMSGPSGWGDGHFIDMQGVTRVKVARVSSTGWGNCTAFTGCQDTEVSGCVAENVSNCAFDHWGGSGNMRVIGNHATIAAGVAGSFGIMVTGMQTNGSPGHSARAVIVGNQLTIIGGTSQTSLGSCIEINGGDDAGRSSVTDVAIGMNQCLVTRGCTHRGIHLAQAVSAVTVQGNILRGGSFGPAITATGPNHAVVARNCVVDGNIILEWPVASSQAATISWYGIDSTLSNNRGRGVSNPFINRGIDPSNLQADNTAN